MSSGVYLRSFSNTVEQQQNGNNCTRRQESQLRFACIIPAKHQHCSVSRGSIPARQSSPLLYHLRPFKEKLSCIYHWRRNQWPTQLPQASCRCHWLLPHRYSYILMPAESHLLPFPYLLMWLVPLLAGLTLQMSGHPCRCSIISTFSLFPASQQFTL